MVQLDAHPTGDQEVVDSTPPGRQHSVVEMDHEIFSTVILSLSLIQEEQLYISFWRKNMRNTVNRLED